jgi:hypothetical protein
VAAVPGDVSPTPQKKKSGSVDDLSVETVASDDNFFRRFCPFVAFEIIYNNVRLRSNAGEYYKMHVEINGVQCQNSRC